MPNRSLMSPRGIQYEISRLKKRVLPSIDADIEMVDQAVKDCSNTVLLLNNSDVDTLFYSLIHQETILQQYKCDVEFTLSQLEDTRDDIFWRIASKFRKIFHSK